VRKEFEGNDTNKGGTSLLPRLSRAPTLSKDIDAEKKLVAESQLKGNTLRTYIYVVTHKKSGVREVQRELHFSSSSLAQYHLAKLVDLGLLTENGGEYFLADQIRVDVLKDFLKFGTFIVPRFVFYAVFFTIISAFFGFIVVDGPFSELNVLFVVLLCVASGLFWYEALRAWLRGPV
jgi:predicted DNA-binding transcriptional regulator